jgi:hypothetical protein
LGSCYDIESIFCDPSERAKVLFNEGDIVTMLIGTQSNGQGCNTVYDPFSADRTGLSAAWFLDLQWIAGVTPYSIKQDHSAHGITTPSQPIQVEGC